MTDYLVQREGKIIEVHVVQADSEEKASETWAAGWTVATELSDMTVVAVSKYLPFTKKKEDNV